MAGHTCFNDGSLRDEEHKSSPWTIGKNFYRTIALGLELVIADELLDGARGLSVTSLVTASSGETVTFPTCPSTAPR